MINSSWGSSPPSVLEKMEGRRRMRQKWKKRCLRERSQLHMQRENEKEVKERKAREIQESMHERKTKTERD